MLFLSLILYLHYTVAQNLQVFVVPHSHDDTGWLRTVDQYFHEEVQWTYTSVVQSLLANPQRKFVAVEIAFFSRWWAQQNNQTKASVKQLIAAGQLEVINGGWCMADEAITHYESLIQQWTLGHQWIKNELGVTPKVGWHIDPFGESNTFPTLFHDLGFTSFFINRIDYRLKDTYKQNKQLEFTWRGSPSRGSSVDMFTHILDSHYSAVSGFDWEYFNGLGGYEGDAPSNPWIVGSTNGASSFDTPNIDDRATAYVNVCKQRAAWFQTNNLFVPFGDDFKFQDAEKQYSNFDLLVNYINSNKAKFGVDIQYAVVSDYITAVQKSAQSLNITWPVVTHDFYPYATDTQSYWTGYFTSRPALKGAQHDNIRALHAADIVLSFTSVFDRTRNGTGDGGYYSSPSHPLFKSREVDAVSNHHDWITGTSATDVVQDQTNRLQASATNSQGVTASSLNTLLCQGKNVPSPNLTTSATTLNQLTSGKTIAVVTYNPLAYTVYRIAVIGIPIPAVNITDSKGAPIVSQVDTIYWEGTPYRVAFPITMPAVGFQTYFITPATAGATTSVPSTTYKLNNRTFIDNEHLQLNLDPSTGLLLDITNKETLTKIPAKQNLRQYISSSSSNAYVFQPNGVNADEINNKANDVTITVGPYMQQVWQNFTAQVNQEITLYNQLPFPGTNYIVFKPTVSAAQDREIIARFETGLNNNDPTLNVPIFYTDANGMEVQKRVINQTGWGGAVTSPVAGNYYPTATNSYIRDETLNAQLTCITDRAHGVSALRKGELEVMLHRRNNENDGTIPLDDTTSIPPAVHCNFENVTSGTVLQRLLPNFYSNTYHQLYGVTTSPSSWLSSYGTSLNFFATSLPLNLHLLTLATTQDPSQTSGPVPLILRLQHLFAAGEHPTYSQPVTLDLKTLFTCQGTFACLQSIQEVSLSATTVLNTGISVITFQPMTIRTFIITLSAPSS